MSAAEGGAACIRACINRTSTMLASSTTSRSHSSWLPLWLLANASVSPSVPQPRRRWMVLAGMPVLSLSRLAARPVGAVSSDLTPLALRICRTLLSRVVLPTPGPPVTTSTLEVSAMRSASRWDSPKRMPTFSSTHSMAAGQSTSGQGGGPAAMRTKLSAMRCSIRNKGARKMHSWSPTVVRTRDVLFSSTSSASSTRLSSTSSTCTAARTRRCLGKPQWPCAVHSERAWRTPARTRCGASFCMPWAPATASAVLNPMPRMSRDRRNGLADTTAMA
mmetsp:Transcript_49017/g.91246  ORF Transcript_49017/g.91246 Transcript_49017/m.91246 type:complete len:276 (+) Transcript_49017:935-1762(+)